MRSIAAAVILLAMPLAAQAQIAPRQPGGARLPGLIEVRASPRDPVAEREVRDARRDIERRRDNGELTKREARRLRREADRIDALSDRYARDGLSAAERSELQLHAQVFANRADPPPRR